jgi:hypothetical protein
VRTFLTCRHCGSRLVLYRDGNPRGRERDLESCLLDHAGCGEAPDLFVETEGESPPEPEGELEERDQG